MKEINISESGRDMEIADTLQPLISVVIPFYNGEKTPEFLTSEEITMSPN